MSKLQRVHTPLRSSGQESNPALHCHVLREGPKASRAGVGAGRVSGNRDRTTSFIRIVPEIKKNHTGVVLGQGWDSANLRDNAVVALAQLNLLLK